MKNFQFFFHIQIKLLMMKNEPRGIYLLVNYLNLSNKYPCNATYLITLVSHITTCGRYEHVIINFHFSLQEL